MARVAEQAAQQLRSLCLLGSEQAAEAGAFEALVAAMLAHPQVAVVQEAGCSALINLSFRARAQRAAEAVAIEALVGAMRAHAQVNGLHAHGCTVLLNVCVGDYAAARARQLQAANAGGLQALVGAIVAMRRMRWCRRAAAGCCFCCAVEAPYSQCAVYRLADGGPSPSPCRHTRATTSGNVTGRRCLISLMNEGC